MRWMPNNTVLLRFALVSFSPITVSSIGFFLKSSPSENAHNNTYIYFTYHHLEQTVTIEPKYPTLIILPLSMLLLLLLIFKKHANQPSFEYARPHTQAGSSLITNPSVPYESGLARHVGSNVGSNLYDPIYDFVRKESSFSHSCLFSMNICFIVN